jgi:hypothetical protein
MPDPPRRAPASCATRASNAIADARADTVAATTTAERKANVIVNLHSCRPFFSLPTELAA